MRSPQRQARLRAGCLPLAAAVLMGLAGCSSHHGSGGQPLPLATPDRTAVPSAAGSTAQSPAPTRTSTGDPVNDGYVLFWQAFLNAQISGNPNYPDLTKHATGQALTFTQQLVTSYHKNGWIRVDQNGYQINSKVIDHSPASGRVTDVQNWTKLPLVVRATGVIVAGSNPPEECITAGLVPRGQLWVVSTISFAAGRC